MAKCYVSAFMAIPMIFLAHSLAFGANFNCPEPSLQVAREVDVDIKGKAQTLLKVAGADIEGTTKTAVIDLYSKYPNADRVAIINTMISTTCNFIKNSTQLDDNQKLDRWMSAYQSILILMPKTELQSEGIKWRAERLCYSESGSDDKECPASVRIHRPAEWTSDDNYSWNSTEDEGVSLKATISMYNPNFKLDGLLSPDGMGGSIIKYNSIQTSYHYRSSFYRAPVIQFIQEPDEDRGNDNYVVIDEYFHDEKYSYVLNCEIKQKLIDKYRDICHHFLEEVSSTAGE